MKKLIALITILAMTAALFAGCKDNGSSALKGKWAYIHEPETVVLNIKGTTAEYEGKKYNYSESGEFFTLTRENEELKFRFKLDKDGFYLYKTTTYTYDGEGTPDSIIGVWTDDQERWAFEFTDKGTFKEDGIFPGHYMLNDDGTFKLAYEDPFEDTICSLENGQGDQMIPDFTASAV